MIISLIKRVLRHAIDVSHWKVILLGVIFLVVSTFILLYLDPKQFKDPFNSFWFVMTTVSQVGYGDHVPETAGAKLYTMLIYLVGVGLFAVMVAKWIDFITTYEKKKGGHHVGTHVKDHIVMITWSQKTAVTLETLLAQDESLHIVVIDQLKQLPYQHPHVHHIQGRATDEETLKKARVCQARSVSIFAPDHPVDFEAIDGKAVLIATTIRQFCKRTSATPYIVSELLHEDHIQNSAVDCFDEWLLSHRPFSHCMAKSVLKQH
ncbi:potassium channel family protein [Shouchella lonarensis]|uniref:Voltage-gated potassium channel n=1 Tax=Shouchella lonarensis TaxID=1464122 RepID=A0A1G6GWU2_9BACI|nr:potassium channel family protein [Shouchella lonarensis]SDB86449.1 voltage-gated potassium channel [Shouchella lonarensis]